MLPQPEAQQSHEQIADYYYDSGFSHFGEKIVAVVLFEELTYLVDNEILLLTGKFGVHWQRQHRIG